ncbi:MAG: hypothetical protein M3P49_11285, partial [Actinomycetota bacterium]|nr:hypothetical protein [Actinomycetota bacterium]
GEPVVDLETVRSAANWALYTLAQDILHAETEEQLSGGYQEGASALAVQRCQEVILILEGVPVRDAPKIAGEIWGDTVEGNRERARTFVKAREREVGNRMLNTMTAESLIHHIKNEHGVDVTVDELEKTLSSSPHDPARIELLDYLPGTEAEIREVLGRRDFDEQAGG